MASRQDHKVPNGIGEPHDGGLVDDDDDAIAVDHSDSQAASESKHPHQANGHRIDDIDHEDEDGNDDDGDGDFDEEDESLFHMVNGVRYPRVPISKELGENVILVRDISKVYHIGDREEGVRALDCITLTPESEFYPIRRGEFVMLRGPSGGGKTTLLNILGAIDRATSGRVEILGDVIDEKSSDEYLASLRLSKIGFVFQTFNLLATMSAFENVELPMSILNRYPPKRRAKRALKLLKRVGLQDRTSHLPSELSGGEQQRVTIARALSNKPLIMLLDEPTGDLDTKNTIEIMDLLLDINLKYRTTFVMVTHNPDIECYADRILYVNDGRFIKQALNYHQTRLVYDDYIKFLNSQEESKGSMIK